ncbi:MAG: hypothetical protein LBS64_03155 [Spirochaetaceae bacterium]|jgi:hypothetical protein|nr:hypothetical protein [Spirochaetaceae bacterium]
MITSAKFAADVRRLIKRDREEQGGSAPLRVCRKIADLFAASAPEPALAGLARSIGAYWLAASADYTTESREFSPRDRIDWLCEALEFLELEGENTSTVIPQRDWIEIRDLVSQEADGLPLEILLGMMQILVTKGVV